jgi:Tfp pilus assembly protein PilP
VVNPKELHRAPSKELSLMEKKMGTILLMWVFLFFVGCGGDAPKPTKVPIAPVGQKPAAPPPGKESPRPVVGEVKPVEPLPALAYSYKSHGKANPFQPLVIDRVEAPPPTKKVEGAPKSKEEEPSTPLEKVDLSALKLVAIVWDIPNPRAMVEDQGGKGYILTAGTRIGKNRGQVSKIGPAGVFVSEKYEGTDGKLKTREVPLRLYAE